MTREQSRNDPGRIFAKSDRAAKRACRRAARRKGRAEVASDPADVYSRIMLTGVLALGLAGVAGGGYAVAKLQQAVESELEPSRVAGPYPGAAVLPAQLVEEGYGPSPLTWAVGLVFSLAVAFAVARCLERCIACPLSRPAATASELPGGAAVVIGPALDTRMPITLALTHGWRSSERTVRKVSFGKS